MCAGFRHRQFPIVEDHLRDRQIAIQSLASHVIVHLGERTAVMNTGQDLDYLDGNAAAGALQELFRIEITAMTAQCDGCGDRAVLARARVYQRAPGVVLRCSGCDGVRMRLVSSPQKSWLDVSGVAQLTFN
jgi:hypothetical protein